MVVALVGLIFILLLVFILIIRGQSKKYAKKSESGELGLWGRGQSQTGSSFTLRQDRAHGGGWGGGSCPFMAVLTSARISHSSALLPGSVGGCGGVGGGGGEGFPRVTAHLCD